MLIGKDEGRHLENDTPPATAFSFEKDASPGPDAETVMPTPEQSHSDTDLQTLQRIHKSIEAVGNTTYHWVIESDQIKWSPNVEAILGCPLSAVSSGRSYANLLDSDNITSRYDTVMRSNLADQGEGVVFEIEYQLRPQGRDGRSAIWVEDHGRWFADKDGRPVEVFGTLRRIDDRHSRDQHLSFLGNCDPLTGMMNRGRLAEALNETIAMTSREHGSCAFLIAAINNMEIVNDAYGFEVADEVIVAMGRRLRQVVRTGDAIARYSGSKFGIILNNCSEQDVGVAINRFINLARESVIETEHGPVWAMLSIGAVMMPRHAQDANLAMARAEEALAEARRLPSDGHVLYRPSPDRAAIRSMNARYATEIVSCLKADHFKLAFQPIVANHSHEIYMHEALLRMLDSNNELIAAAHLIPVAEKLGLVRLIDRAVAHLTIATLHAHPTARLSMNVSGATATDPRWFHQLVDIIRANSSVAPRLIIEITETVALGNMKEAFAFVEALRTIGCSVAIDDFGAGFTSFSNLLNLPVNIIKLDGGFCIDLAHNATNQYLLRTLSDLGHKFGLKVIAEWVEKEEDLTILKDFNIDYLQGNLFGTASTSLPWPKLQQEDATAFNVRELSRQNAIETRSEDPVSSRTIKDEANSEQETSLAFSETSPTQGGQGDANLQISTPSEMSSEIGEEVFQYEPELEEGLSKLRQAIQSLDQHIRSHIALENKSNQDQLEQGAAS